MNEEEIPIEKQTEIIELKRRDPQSEAKYWNEKYIETLLELFKEKEKNKKLENEVIMLRMTHDYDAKMIDEVKGNAVELYKVIDMMAEDIMNPNYFCSKELEEKLLGKDYNKNKKQEIKEYYFKKARGEE